MLLEIKMKVSTADGRLRNPVWPSLILCDPGWCVHKSGVQNKWDGIKHTHTFNKHTHTHTHTHREDQCEWHRMTRMTGPDCVVMCNLINTHTHKYTHTHTHSIIDPPLGGSMRVAWND